MNNSYSPLEIFIKRLNKINVSINLISNYPWIYLDKINGKKVIEKYESEHAFTLGFSPIKKGDVFKFSDISYIFKIIRKYA